MSTAERMQRKETAQQEGRTQLIVQGDDFGMCHAVNVGTQQAFRDGLMTQASIMVACPWFDEAVAIARAEGIPLGVHQTLTCEWDYLRWRPLTAGTSLVAADGTFYRSIADAQAHVTHEDAVIEVTAQAERFRAEGLPITYLDQHMGAVISEAYEEVAADLGHSYIYGRDRAQFTSVVEISKQDAGAKRAYFDDYVQNLGPGIHLLVFHAAVSDPELRAITGSGTDLHRWTEEYRASDFEILLDPKARIAIEERDIEFVSFAEAFGI